MASNQSALIKRLRRRHGEAADLLAKCAALLREAEWVPSGHER